MECLMSHQAYVRICLCVLPNKPYTDCILGTYVSKHSCDLKRSVNRPAWHTKENISYCSFKLSSIFNVNFEIIIWRTWYYRFHCWWCSSANQLLAYYYINYWFLNCVWADIFVSKERNCFRVCDIYFEERCLAFSLSGR